MQRALNVSRSDFPEWYQAVVRDADMAETSPVRGCMIIKPWGYGVWERIQRLLDQRIRDTGHENAYFPLFIPMSFIAKEAEHVAGFAKEMAVVTHHRLKVIDGKLQPDPDAKLEEPMIVRPTSETIIGDAFSRWVKSHRDLPVLINQWANVVRWEMRTRLFLRTAEFLWQEGHTAHATADEALAETMKMLEVYREFAEGPMAMPVMAGEKPANERFPGAVSTFSIEAMMQDGKALQAGTSHYLGQHFAEAQNIRFQNDAGEMAFCHTTSWGVSTRLIGGLIMTHGDDDGLRLPPELAPQQIVIVPMLRGKPEDGALLEYCDAIAKELKGKVCLSETIRAQVDTKSQKSAEKRWNWVRRGAPIIVEIGGRDMANGTVTFMRRDTLRDGDKVISHNAPRDEFINKAAELLTEIQTGLFNEAKAKRDAAIVTGVNSFEDMAAYFSGDENATKGWIKASWARPEGAELEAIADKLKAMKLTLRNAPLDQPSSHGKCLFTGRDGVEEIFVARAY